MKSAEEKNGYLYTKMLIEKGEFISIHNVMMDYKYHNVPSRYADYIWGNCDLFEKGVREAVQKHKK